MTRRSLPGLRHVAATLLGSFALAGTLGGCDLPFSSPPETATPIPCDAAGLPTGPVSFAEVDKHVEARLAYPGSRIVSRFGGAEYHHLFSGHDDAAFSGAILATAATPAQLYPWYEQWALKRGWRPYDFS